VLAALRLSAEQVQVRGQGCVLRMFATQLAEQRADRRQRRVEVVRGGGCLGRDREDSLVAQRALALVRDLRLALAQCAGEARDEERQHRRDDAEVRGGREYVQVGAAARAQGRQVDVPA